jgi:hypothetical protein
MVRDDTDRRQALTRELVGLQATSSWQERGAAVALQLQEIEKRWSLCWTDDRNALRYRSALARRLRCWSNPQELPCHC